MATAQQQQTSSSEHLAQRDRCKWCAGYGKMRLLSDGEAVTWDDPRETNIVSFCYCGWRRDGK